MKHLLLVLLFVVSFVHGGFAYAEQCQPGYFLDEENVCQICPAGYYCDGVGVPMACPEMPELPDDKWWGYYANNAVSGGMTGTVTDCSGGYIYGNLPSYQRIVEMFNSGDMALFETDVAMSMLCLIWGSFIEPYENPKYSATSPINSAGAGVVMLTYDETAKKYIIGVLATECHAGYWAEYGIASILSDGVFVVETPQQISDYLCKPVGTGYWGGRVCL